MVDEDSTSLKTTHNTSRSTLRTTTTLKNTSTVEDENQTTVMTIPDKKNQPTQTTTNHSNDSSKQNQNRQDKENLKQQQQQQQKKQHRYNKNQKRNRKQSIYHTSGNNDHLSNVTFLPTTTSIPYAMDLFLYVPNENTTMKKTPPTTIGTGIGSSLSLSGVIVPNTILIPMLLKRLFDLGYHHGAALTHICPTGRPTFSRDDVSQTIQPRYDQYIQYIQQYQSQQQYQNSSKMTTKTKPFQLLKRLHIVVENLSDVGLYAASMTTTPNITATSSSSSSIFTPNKKHSKGNQNSSNNKNNNTNHPPTPNHQDHYTNTKDSIQTIHRILYGYDIVSLCPMNDATFQAICNGNSDTTTTTTTSSCSSSNNMQHVDMITLDYTATTRGLPYRLKYSDVLGAVKQNLIFEIPYSTALFHSTKYRPLFCNTIRELYRMSQQMKKQVTKKSTTTNFGGSGDDNSSTTTTMRILLSSSGLRHNSGQDIYHDIGPLALRSPSDLANIATALLGLSSRSAIEVITPGQYIQECIQQRRKRVLHYYYQQQQQQQQMSTTTMHHTTTTKNPSNNHKIVLTNVYIDTIDSKKVDAEQRTGKKRSHPANAPAIDQHDDDDDDSSDSDSDNDYQNTLQGGEYENKKKENTIHTRDNNKKRLTKNGYPNDDSIINNKSNNNINNEPSDMVVEDGFIAL